VWAICWKQPGLQGARGDGRAGQATRLAHTTLHPQHPSIPSHPPPPSGPRCPLGSLQPPRAQCASFCAAPRAARERMRVPQEWSWLSQACSERAQTVCLPRPLHQPPAPYRQWSYPSGLKRQAAPAHDQLQPSAGARLPGYLWARGSSAHETSTSVFMLRKGLME